MLRLIFVFSIIIAGIIFAVQGPFWALMFYLWNAYFRPELWVWDDFVSPLKLSLIVGAFLLLTSFREIHKLKFTRQTVFILLFLAQCTLSLVVSEDFDWSLRYWTEFLKVIIITILITFLVSDLRRYRIALLVIGFSLGFEQAKQGWAQFVLNPGATNANPHPMLGDNNGVAVGMMMLVPVFLALSQTANRRWERYIHRFFIFGVIYRGISTYSRGGFLAAAAMGLVALYRSPKKFRALISVAVLIAMIASVMPQTFWDRMKTIQAPEGEREVSAESRLFVWGVGLHMAAEKPITGVGFNGFQRSFDTYDVTGGQFGQGKAAHSSWFGVLGETGYPGLVLFVLIILSALYNLWSIRRRTKHVPEMKDARTYAGAMQMSIVAYIVGNTFLSGQYLEMFWHFMGLCVALDRITAGPLTASGVDRVDEKAIDVGSASARPHQIQPLGGGIVGRARHGEKDSTRLRP